MLPNGEIAAIRHSCQAETEIPLLFVTSWSGDGPWEG